MLATPGAKSPRLPACRTRRGLLALVISGLALGGCTGRTEATPATDGAATGEAKDFCIGRYALRLPGSARVIGWNQWMAHLAISLRDLPPGTSLEEAAALSPQLSAVPGDAVTDRTRQVLDRETVLLGWRNRYEDAHYHELLRVLPRLLLSVSGPPETALAIARASEPLGEPAQEGFCIDRVVIRRGFAWQESASVGIELAPGQRLFIEIATNGQRTPRGLRERGGSILGTITWRSHARRLAGHEGEEMVLVRGGGREMLLMWRFAGVALSGAEPSIDIRLEAQNVASPEVVLARWDAMLVSLRRRSA